MKAHLSIVVIASLVVTPLPGCATAVGPRQIDVTSDGPVPSESDWSRVGELSPGAEIVLTRRGSQAACRRFVSADNVDVTVLNLTDRSLPEAATRVLRDMALQRPESFAAMRTSGATFGQGDVRIGSGGLFVSSDLPSATRSGRQPGEAHTIGCFRRGRVTLSSRPGRASGPKSPLGAVMPNLGE